MSHQTETILHSPYETPYEDACFYPAGILATIRGPKGSFDIEAQGELRVLNHETGQEIRDSDELRRAFPTGRLPDETGEETPWEVSSNRWWALIHPNDPCGELDDVCDSFHGALEAALEAAGVPSMPFDEFVQRDGDACPHCWLNLSGRESASFVEASPGSVQRVGTCPACRTSWTELWNLRGYAILTPQPEPTPTSNA